MSRHAATSLDRAAIAPMTMYLPVVKPNGPDIIGQSAVSAGLKAEISAENSAYFLSIGETALAQEMEQQAAEAYLEAHRMIQGIRAKVGATKERKVARNYLERHMGEEFAIARAKGTTHTDIVSWMADADHGATTEQIYDFAVRHVENIENMQQDHEVQVAINNARTTYVAGIYQGVKEGALSPTALQSLSKPQTAQVLVGDIWDEVIMQGSAAYHVPGTSYVIVGPGETKEDTIACIYKSVPHELEHLQFYKPGEYSWPRWLLEARAQHVATSIAYGDWDVLNPADRWKDLPEYKEERELLATIANGGKKPIDPRIITRAISSPLGSPEWVPLNDALEASWGKDILTWVNKSIKLYETELGKTQKYSMQGVHVLALKTIINDLKTGYYPGGPAENAPSSPAH